MQENIMEVFALKVRIKFEKTEQMRFIGHLDIMRYFQKAMRRADIPIKYSEGFSPHQIMSFGAPLSMGVSGLGEYMDIELKEGSHISSKEAIKRLNEIMCTGMKVTKFLQIPDNSKPAMALMDTADFKAEFKTEVNESEINAAIEKLMSKESILLTKVSKKKKKNQYGKFVEVETTSVVDIKPFIYKLEAIKNGVYMHLSQGSTNNIKPAAVMEFLYEEGLSAAKKNEYYLYRLDMYTDEGKALDEYGCEII